MHKLDELIELGLSKEGAQMLLTPLCDLPKEQLKLAIIANDKKTCYIRKRNDMFVSKKASGFPQIMNRDGFEAFQSPCDTNVIITNERERQEDMKRNGCIDAREFIPHGKTSLLDGNI